MGLPHHSDGYAFSTEEEKNAFVSGLEAALADMKTHLQWFLDARGGESGEARGVKMDIFCVERKIAAAKKGRVAH